MKNKNYKTLKASILGISVLIVSQAFGATNYVSGPITDGASWNNLLPGPSNPGTIAVNATIDAVNMPVGAGTTTITHSAGTITGQTNITSANPLNWIQDGGTVSSTNFFTFNENTNYELRSGTMSFASSGGGSRFQIANTNSSFSQTGGTTNGIGFEFVNSTGTSVLSGGVGNDLGAAWLGAAFWVRNSSLEITGDYTANFNSGFTNASGTSAGVIAMEGTGVIDFSSTWLGSFNNTAFDGGTLWQDALTQTGIQVDGTQVTAGNFGDFFEISNGGTTVTAIPEPSSIALLGLAGFAALLLFRRK